MVSGLPPTLETNGFAMVGGPVAASLIAPGGQDIMQSVTWTVSGSMQSQTYQNSIGTTPPLSGSVTHTWNGGSVGYDSFSPFWNATPGKHTISVSITYSDGTKGNASITVNVAQPTFNSFSVIFGRTEWAGNKTSGLIQTHMTYAASVTAPANQGGQIRICQKIT